LTLFSGSIERNNPEHAWALRRQTAFPFDNLYYSAICIDFVLRFTWSLKLSPHLDHFNDWEGGIFVMELLEVLRRWIWIFFRVETEWVRHNKGPAADEILLSSWEDDPDKINYDE
jgi:EXS family